ncbi:MAG: redox-regulated ATPase YchF [Candidatus Pacearchaeota archaeon]
MLLGLVGKPSAGKSTFFKAATMAEVDIASYAFTTIKPNHGVGYVRVECVDKDFDAQCNPNKGFCINHQRFVPVELVDVAGLVEGASEGKGLGNQFLDDLREADVFMQVVDSSGKTDSEGRATKNHDPREDVRFLEKELDLWFYNILVKAWKTFSRKLEVEVSNEGKFADAVASQFSGLKINREQVKEVLLKLSLPEQPSKWTDEQLKSFASELRKKSKPMIIAGNKCDDPDAEENLRKLKETFTDYYVVPCSADSELALRQAAKQGLIEYVPGDNDFIISADLGEKQKEALEKIKENVLQKFEHGTGVQKVLNTAVLELLNHIAVFPGSPNKLADSKGNVLPDCFLLPKGSTTLDFAYYLHTDFGKNFIKAVDARTKMAMGKDHELKHRDVFEILT